MPEAAFFVRVRGKISGPYDIGNLQKLVRRGMLSRIHEISEDRVTWNPAGDYEELFPERVAAPDILAADDHSGYQSQRSEAAAHAQAAALGTAVSAAPGPEYFYAQNGRSVGPVSLSVLAVLAQNGSVGADDPVWKAGDAAAVPARQVAGLAPFYSGGDGYSSTRGLHRTRQTCITLFVSLVTALLLGILVSVADIPLRDARGKISGLGYVVVFCGAVQCAALVMGIYSIIFLPLRWKEIMRLHAGPKVLGLIGGFGLILYLLLIIAVMVNISVNHRHFDM